MADKKITQLTEITTTTNNDMFVMVDDTTGATKKVKAQNALPDSVVSTAKVADGAVTNAKLATASGEPGGAWATYTPTITNFTVGNGTVSARYSKIGRTVHVHGRATFGTTTSLTGALSISLPTAAVSSVYAARETIGVGHIIHPASGQHTSVFVMFASTTTVTLTIPTTVSGSNPVFTETGPSREASNTTPWVWASTDILSWHLTYEAAA